MKILYTSPSNFPSKSANTIHVMKMCQAFQQEGHKTILVFPSDQRINLDLESLWRHYGIFDPFAIKSINISKWPGNLKYHAFGILSAYYAIKNQVDLVFGRSIHGVTVPAILGIPTVLETHTPSVVNARYFRILINGSGLLKIVVITNALKKALCEDHKVKIKAEKIIVAPDGVDLERFNRTISSDRAKQNIGINTNKFTIGYSGHLYQGRGISLIFNLAEQLPEYQFLIIGGSDGDLQWRKKELEGRKVKNIFFTGFIENIILPQFLSACDVLLLPYQNRVFTTAGGGCVETSKWMSPMKLFEYMASERLIISSNLPVLKEILNPSNAIFCEPTNLHEWILAIKNAVNSPMEHKRIAQKARKDVENYTWRKRVKKILEEI